MTATADYRYDEPPPGYTKSFFVEEMNPRAGTGHQPENVKDCDKGYYEGRIGVAYFYPKEGYRVEFIGKKPMLLISLESKGLKRC